MILVDDAHKENSKEELEGEINTKAPEEKADKAKADLKAAIEDTEEDEFQIDDDEF